MDDKSMVSFDRFLAVKRYRFECFETLVFLTRNQCEIALIDDRVLNRIASEYRSHSKRSCSDAILRQFIMKKCRQNEST